MKGVNFAIATIGLGINGIAVWAMAVAPKVNPNLLMLAALFAVIACAKFAGDQL